MRRLSPALLSASLVATGFAGCKAVVDAQYLAQTTPSPANYTAAVAKDLEAGKHMAMLGDPLSIAIVTKLSAKF
jgi:hypothetical protein